MDNDVYVSTDDDGFTIEAVVDSRYGVGIRIEFDGVPVTVWLSKHDARDLSRELLDLSYDDTLED